MERPLAKRFQDEQIKREIEKCSNVEEMRKLCIQVLDLKIKQEEVMLQMMHQWESNHGAAMQLLNKPTRREG